MVQGQGRADVLLTGDPGVQGPARSAKVASLVAQGQGCAGPHSAGPLGVQGPALSPKGSQGENGGQPGGLVAVSISSSLTPGLSPPSRRGDRLLPPRLTCCLARPRAARQRAECAPQPEALTAREARQAPAAEEPARLPREARSGEAAFPATADDRLSAIVTACGRVQMSPRGPHEVREQGGAVE